MAKLTPLPYDYNALEPTIGRETVNIHHNKHQASYVKGWNETQERLKRARKSGQQSGGMLRGVGQSVAFNGAGIILHEMYWENLCPSGSSPEPTQAFLHCAARCFGTAHNMVEEMAAVGAAIRGSGWVVLAWIPRFQQMVILPISNHEDGWIPGAVPLLVIDVWEHAYYLDYQAARAEYLKLIWHNVNWAVVSRRYYEAT
jgi:Fe-Mn family superoxide dismutase